MSTAEEYIVDHVQLEQLPATHSQLPRWRVFGKYVRIADAEQVLQQLLDAWQPLEFECAVSDFLRLPQMMQRQCVMFQPALVRFPPPRMTLASRLAALLRRPATNVETHATAWAIGLWLSAGQPNSALVCGSPNRLQHGAMLDTLATCFGAARSACGADLGAQFWHLLQAYNLLRHKHVPAELRREDESVRHWLLVGLRDGAGSDECACAKQRDRICINDRRMLRGTLHLARGLGLRAVDVGRTCSCDGNSAIRCYQIRFNRTIDCTAGLQQCKDDQLQCGAECSCGRVDARVSLCEEFTIEPVGMGEYCGFTIDGNGRMLLDDFTVTHNVSRCTALHRAGADFSLISLFHSLFFCVCCRRSVSQRGPRSVQAWPRERQN
jgi:hypothetical protein